MIKQTRYIVLEGYMMPSWMILDTFTNKIIAEYAFDRPKAFEVCERLNKKAEKEHPEGKKD